MKKMILAALCLTTLFSGCNGDSKKAGALFQQAEQAYASGNYSLAKLQIDSIRTLYPKAVEVRKAAIRLMQNIDIQEQQKTLAYLDSMMQVKQAALDSIKGNYVLEKDTAYQEIGNYFYPTQTVEKNIGRSFLRAQVNELGEMSLTFAQTQPSSDSYETTDLGRPIEKADYRVGKDDGGVAAFIVANRDKRTFRLEFIGDRNYRTTMRRDDVKAIAAISDLARILSAMEEIRKEQNEANLKLKFVTRKIEEAEQAER